MKENRRDWRTWKGDRTIKEFWRGVLRSVSDQQEDILVAIADKLLQPKEIANKVNTSQQTVSSQLGKLYELELVDNIQFGRNTYYHVKEDALIEILIEKCAEREQ
jgi:predicted transcriptional regulator